jgi:hypothetical protein
MTRRYANGYPHRVIRERRRETRQMIACFPGCAIMLAIALLASVGGSWATWDKLRNDPTLGTGWPRVRVWVELIAIGVATVPTVLVALATFICVAAVIWHVWRAAVHFVLRHVHNPPRPGVPPKYLQAVRIVPCFEKPVGLDWRGTAVESGHALAANSERLDSIAEDNGVVALTDFGLDDDISKQIEWRSASEGLRTIAMLLERLSISQPEDDSVRNDLRLLQGALEQAAIQDVGFCLVLRMSDDSRVTPSGELARKGYYQ